MKVRITMRNKYIVTNVDSMEEALDNLKHVIPLPDEVWSVWLEHGLVLATEEIYETH